MELAKPKIYKEEDYYSLPENIRAELIDGDLIYNQAAPSRKHRTILTKLLVSISNYIDSKAGSCQVYPAPFAVKLMEDRNTVVEPDISVICDKDKLTDRGCTGAPDWIIEIVSPGNLRHDYVLKLNLYNEAGVREYWIVDPAKESVWVYYFEESEFKAETYSFKDEIKVNIYDDLYIDFAGIDM